MARHQGKTQSPGAMRSCSACLPNFNQIYFWVLVDSYIDRNHTWGPGGSHMHHVTEIAPSQSTKLTKQNTYLFCDT